MNRKIDAKKLDRIHKKLTRHIGREVTWEDFAEICNLTRQTMDNLRNERTIGSARTLRKIVKGLHSRGLKVKTDDLLTAGSNSERLPALPRST